VLPLANDPPFVGANLPRNNGLDNCTIRVSNLNAELALRQLKLEKAHMIPRLINNRPQPPRRGMQTENLLLTRNLS
jgi:hypothetical protein